MPVAYPDIIERPPRATWDRSGKTAVRTFLMNYGGPIPDVSILVNLGGGIPLRGDPYPGNQILACDVVDAEIFQDPNHALITCTYRRLSAVTGEPSLSAMPLWSVGSTVQDAEVSLDANGQPMLVPYSKNGVAQTPSKAIATIQRPNCILRGRRREPYLPSGKGLAFTGHTNSNVMFGVGAGTLLITRIEGVSEDDGISWVVEYELQYKADGWKVGAWYVDPDTGLVPADATLANGYATFNVYGPVDFSPLNLSLPA